MKVIITCLLISYLTIFATCTKSLDCRGTIHSFEAFYKAYPDKDSIRIGDTIWLELNTPTLLKDLFTNKMVDFSDAGNFGTAIGYVELTGGDLLNPGAVPAANDFENILVNGTSTQPFNPAQVRKFLFEEQNDMYLFKLGIIPKRKGLFMIGPGNATGVYQKSDRCRKSSFNLTFKDTDQHLYLLQQSRPGYTLSEYERTHAYAFKVY